jgi:hypothetical protein
VRPQRKKRTRIEGEDTCIRLSVRSVPPPRGGHPTASVHLREWSLWRTFRAHVIRGLIITACSISQHTLLWTPNLRSMVRLTRFHLLALRNKGIGICTQSTWEVRFSNTRKVPYFFNTETQQSVWNPPEELTPEKIEKLPGAELLKVKEVRASHVLVKHSGSRRPSSWKEVSPTAFSSSLHPHNLLRLINASF